MQTRARAGVAILTSLCLAVLGGCSSSSGPGSGGGDGSSSGSGSSSGGGSSGGAVCSMAPSITTPYVGSVKLGGSYAHPTFFVQGAFGPLVSGGDAGGGGGSSGACNILCAADAPFANSLDMSTSASAGTLTVTDGSSMVATLPFGGGMYASPMSTSQLWSPGDTLTVSASGATLQAFTGTVRAPHPIAALQPSPGSSTSASIGSGLTVSWQPDTIGGARMQVQLDALMNGRPTGIIDCWADDASGKITVPTSVLSMTFGGGGMGILIASRMLESLAQGPNATVQLLNITGTLSSSVTFTP